MERNLWAYAAAGAAGVGMLAMSSKAEAKVVYTAANEQVPRLSVVPVDLNGDGSVDFNLVNWLAVSGGNSNVYSYLAVCHTKAKGPGTFACIASSSLPASDVQSASPLAPLWRVILVTGRWQEIRLSAVSFQL